MTLQLDLSTEAWRSSLYLKLIKKLEKASPLPPAPYGDSGGDRPAEMAAVASEEASGEASGKAFISHSK